MPWHPTANERQWIVAGTVACMSDQQPTGERTWEQWGDDKVSITKDGRRLDTAEKVIEFFAELDAERESTAGLIGPDDAGRRTR